MYSTDLRLRARARKIPKNKIINRGIEDLSNEQTALPFVRELF